MTNSNIKKYLIGFEIVFISILIFFLINWLVADIFPQPQIYSAFIALGMGFCVALPLALLNNVKFLRSSRALESYGYKNLPVKFQVESAQDLGLTIENIARQKYYFVQFKKNRISAVRFGAEGSFGESLLIEWSQVGPNKFLIEVSSNNLIPWSMDFGRNKANVLEFADMINKISHIRSFFGKSNSDN